MRARLGFERFVLHFGTFNFEMLCIVGPRTNLVKFVRQQMCDPDYNYDAAGKLGAHFSRKGYSPIIWLPRRPRTPTEYATLAHEVLHVLREMLVDWAGIPLTADTDEVFCHAMSYAVRTLGADMRRKP